MCVCVRGCGSVGGCGWMVVGGCVCVCVCVCVCLFYTSHLKPTVIHNVDDSESQVTSQLNNDDDNGNDGDAKDVKVDLKEEPERKG